MRLPIVDNPSSVDVAIFGVPWDGGTTNRPGPRHGPRQVREASGMIRKFHGVTKVSPFELCRVGDLGDAPVNPVDLHRALETVRDYAKAIVDRGATPLAIGGDHLVSLPLLRAVRTKQTQALGLIHFDSHLDMADIYFGDQKYTHGTPFRRAIEENLLDPRRVVQVGIRGSIYSTDEEEWVLKQEV